MFYCPIFPRVQVIKQGSSQFQASTTQIYHYSKFIFYLQLPRYTRFIAIQNSYFILNYTDLSLFKIHILSSTTLNCRSLPCNGLKMVASIDYITNY